MKIYGTQKLWEGTVGELWALCMPLEVKTLERWFYASHTLYFNFLPHAVKDQSLKAERYTADLSSALS